jgi:putative transposase
MKPDSHIYNRKNIRLKGYDYSGAGSYFVTICIRNRGSFFGIVLNDEIHINDIGRIAMECWVSLSERFPEVSLDEYVFMRNHLHGIINIVDNQGVINKGAMNSTPTGVITAGCDKSHPSGCYHYWAR